MEFLLQISVKCASKCFLSRSIEEYILFFFVDPSQFVIDSKKKNQENNQGKKGGIKKDRNH